MALLQKKSRRLAAIPLMAALGLALSCSQPAQAVPAFARKDDLKCYSCHTIPPALDKTGYMFKRLAYRLPPHEMDRTKLAPKITQLGKEIKIIITNSLALIRQATFT